MEMQSTEAIYQFLRKEDIDALFRPIEQARGLPGVVYTSSEFLELERRKTFRNGWHGVGFAHEILEPGDAIPLSVA